MRLHPDRRVESWFAEHRRQSATTSVSAAELLYGAARLKSARRRDELRDKIEPVLNALSVAGRLYAFGHDEAIEFAILKATCEAEGWSRPNSDLMIAATCIVRRCPIATRNVKHFEGLGIEVIDPWAG